MNYCCYPRPRPKEIYYHPVEIEIAGAGLVVKIEQALPLLYDTVEGVVIIHPGGDHGKGTLGLGVAGEEIFPTDFHARAFMQIHSSHHHDAIITKDLDKYMYEFTERAKGSTISVKYTEPSDGTSGVLFMVFKLTRYSKC
jgi:hypothetical protein